MEILTRRIGDPGNVTRYRVEGFDSSPGRGLVEPVIRETVVQRPSGLHPAALLVRFKVCVCLCVCVVCVCVCVQSLGVCVCVCVWVCVCTSVCVWMI